ncbi:hypothetical protein GT354_22410 [Streptomyces sp. SID3343]|nr:hypothetical protein [Streptomyces sp. SID3343]
MSCHNCGVEHQGRHVNEFEEVELFAELATRLKVAHARVRRLQLPNEAKVALIRRLLVITDAAKHDLSDASRRLAKLMKELDAGPAS